MRGSKRPALPALILAGLSVGPAMAGGPPAPITVPYRCDDGTALTAGFDRTAERATVSFAGMPPMTLPQAVSGSGFRYSDGRHELHGKGDEALWIVDGTVTLHCRAAPERQ